MFHTCFVRHGWKLVSSKMLLTAVFGNLKFSEMKLKSIDNLNPLKNSICSFSVARFHSGESKPGLTKHALIVWRWHSTYALCIPQRRETSSKTFDWELPMTCLFCSIHYLYKKMTNKWQCMLARIDVWNIDLK